jgi:hypothetical protein
LNLRKPRSVRIASLRALLSEAISVMISGGLLRRKQRSSQ